MRPRDGILVSALVAAIAPFASFAAERSASVWTPTGISTDQYESTPTFLDDGRGLEMYFMLADAKFERYRLVQSRCENGTWTKPQPAPFAVSPPVQEADPGVTPDGKRLYFISTRHDPANEDFDIWFVDRIPGGTWGEPQHLPAPVNSPGSELLPRADRDGRLYFGSDRAGGYGKSDIYVAIQSRDGRWTVQNVGPPVSTTANEYEAEVSRNGRTLIAVVDRGDRSHLYRFEREDGRWLERGKVPAYASVFQVGPLLSPTMDRLLFAQADGAKSGEMFLIELADEADASWPPACRKRRD